MPDEEPLVIHRRARNPKQVVEKPVKIRRRKQVEHKCKLCEQRAEKEAVDWKQVAEASKAMQPITTTAVYTGTWGATPNYPTYNPTTWSTTSATPVTFDTTGYTTGIWQNIGG